MDKNDLEKNRFMEILIMKTPNGGDYSESYFFDENWKYTTKENAQHIIIKEYKNNGELIMETFMDKSDNNMDFNKKELENNKFMEISINKTPNGGDYSETYFFDENWDCTTKENAHHIIIQEYKNNGELVHESFLHNDNNILFEEKKTHKM